MGSAERSKTAGVYYKKRVIRLFPSLAAVVVLSVFILGPLITNLNMQSYFFSIDTYKYLLNAILIPVHDLPGVFTNNVYGQTINGALWTLPVEFVCYVICFTMYQLKLTEYGKFKYTLILFVPAYILLFYVFRNNSLVASVLRIMGMFYAGMLFYVYRDKIKMNFGYACIAFTVFVLSLLFRFTEGTVLLTLSYVFAYLGFGVKKKYHFLDGKPDISYQIYLCAFPLQQLVCMWNGGKMTCGLNFIESLPLVVIIAVLLYEGIDKRIINK